MGKKIFILIAVLVLVVSLVSCAPGPDSRYDVANPAGFWAGLWHGLIALVTLIFSIFTDLKLYEIHNTGFWYELGFFLGFAIMAGAGGHKMKKK